MTLETLTSVFLGIGLAASVGFRIFLPLFALSLASFFDILSLNPHWEWMGHTAAVITFGVAMTAEILAYFIPWFDHLLDTLAIPLAAIAGTAVMVSTLADMSPLLTWTLAIIAGGGTATVIKGSAASGRVASTVSTGGIGNPLVTLIETGTASVVAVAAVFVPVLAIILVVIILILIFAVYKKVRRGFRSG